MTTSQTFKFFSTAATAAAAHGASTLLPGKALSLTPRAPMALRIAEGQAAAFGAPAPEIKIESDYTPATYNDPELTERAMTAIARKLGEGNVRAVPPVMGGGGGSMMGAIA